jgi:hypothetical protein
MIQNTVSGGGGGNVSSTSQVRETATLLLPIVGN